MVRPPDLADRIGSAGQADPIDLAPAVKRPVARGNQARRWGLLLIVGWLAQAGLRAWLSRAQVMPLAMPDESAYLIAARVLAGGASANFSYSTLYPAGYPLLITPVFWFTANPVTAYHAVLMINAAISAALMPLAYVAGRRLRLDRPAAYGVATVAALLPVGLFYAEYALTDAIYPVLVLGWLLAVHSWLTASSSRGRYAAAIGSALLAGYADAVHSRGLVILAGYVAVGALIAWRRLAPRGTVVAAALALGLPLGVASALNGKLAAAMYPSGARSLGGEALIRLRSVHGAILISEQAAGQMWRFVLDGWGVAAIGFVAAVAVLFRRGVRADLKIMAGLSVWVTLAIAIMAPAGLPPDTNQTWASGRYLDAMVVAFFLPGAAILLRADWRQILGYAVCIAPPTLVAAVAVIAYAGASVPTSGFGAGFGFAEPAVLTQDWTRANVLLATAVGLALLAVWVAVVLAAGRWAPRWRGVVLAGLAAVSLVAVVQMTSHVSRAYTSAQEADTTGLVTGSGLKPGEHLAVGWGVSWGAWMPQAYEISWAPLEFFHPATQPPPANASVVEVAWPAGQSARASWPQAPAGWRIVTSDRAEGWVAWRKLDATLDEGYVRRELRPTSVRSAGVTFRGRYVPRALRLTGVYVRRGEPGWGYRRLTSVDAGCEHGAESHDGRAQSMASAPEASRAWLLIEHPGPWPHEPAEAVLPGPLGVVVSSALGLGVRVQLIRRPGSSGPRLAGNACSVYAGWTAGSEPWLRRGEVSAEAAWPHGLELARLAAGNPVSFGSPVTAPLFLVCAHGQRNACCARFGGPLAVQLAARYPGQVFQTTHVGGHRFAANLVILPHGLYYGPVSFDTATAAISAYERGLVAPGRYRGRAGQPQPTQQAEHERLTLTGSLRVAALA